MLEETPVWKVYTADGVQTEWDFPLPYIGADSVKLYVSQDGELNPIPAAKYTFNPTTNKVTYPNDGSAPVKAGDSVLLWRETAVTQEEDSTHVAFKSNDIENMVDKLTAICQELRDQQSRSISYDPTQQSSGMDVNAAEYIQLLEQYKDIAQQKAGEAQESAEDALNSENAAKLSAEQAAQDATDASSYADAAAQSAKNAEDYEEAAKTDADNAADYAIEAYNNAKKFISLPVGSIYYSPSTLAEDNPAAYPAWDGRTIQGADEACPALWAFVIKHPELQKTTSDYNNRLTAYGECPFYVIDTTAKTLRLPRLGSYIKSGTSVSQGLAGAPDITGSFGVDSNSVPVVGGAFYVTGQARGADGGSNNNTALGFSASRSNAVSGRYSDTIHPNHTSMLPWVVYRDTVQDLITHNGGAITLETFTAEAWEQLAVKPVNTLCLIDEDQE